MSCLPKLPPLDDALIATRERAQRYADSRGHASHGPWLAFLMADFVVMESKRKPRKRRAK